MTWMHDKSQIFNKLYGMNEQDLGWVGWLGE